MIWALIRRILFRFDAESAHLFTVRLIRFAHRFCPWFIQIMAAPVRVSMREDVQPTVHALKFVHPLGLAAGFDKNAEMLGAMPDLGFSFAEIGTVTPRAQAGNPRPRLFRDAKTQVIFNRMGFNNDGADVIARRVQTAREHLPDWFRVGINIGKNKDTPNERAHVDYRDAVRPFRECADYVVINVSSPNTPGLRDLQTLSALKPIISEVRDELAHARIIPPLFLKLAPELLEKPAELSAILSETPAWGIKGFVLTNTLSGFWPNAEAEGALQGGYSGRVLQERARNVLIQARKQTSLPLISVGGIDSGAEAARRFAQGATLIQVYSGWIFRGPKLAREIVSAWARSVAN